MYDWTEFLKKKNKLSKKCNSKIKEDESTHWNGHWVLGKISNDKLWHMLVILLDFKDTFSELQGKRWNKLYNGRIISWHEASQKWYQSNTGATFFQQRNLRKEADQE